MEFKIIDFSGMLGYLGIEVVQELGSDGIIIASSSFDYLLVLAFCHLVLADLCVKSWSRLLRMQMMLRALC